MGRKRRVPRLAVGGAVALGVASLRTSGRRAARSCRMRRERHSRRAGRRIDLHRETRNPGQGRFEHAQPMDLSGVAASARVLLVESSKRKSLQQSEIGNGGAEGIRTLDPHVANVVLSQLSYCPTRERVLYSRQSGSANSCSWLSWLAWLGTSRGSRRPPSRCSRAAAGGRAAWCRTRCCRNTLRPPSEALRHGRRIEGLEIVNPFL
jgi:hypothetical protein